MTYIKTNIEGLVRDGSSGAILNNDSVAYTAFKRQRQTQTEHQKLKEEVSDLRSDIQDIKSLLERLLRDQNK